MPSSPAGRSLEGVGGRQGDPATRSRGGGYLDNCTPSNFGQGAEKNRDPRLDELEIMGLQRIWIAIAEEIGVDNFMRMWRILDSDTGSHADDGRLLIPIRRFSTYLRYQRNRYIEALVGMGLSPRQIREHLQRQLCEKLSIRNILRIIKSG